MISNLFAEFFLIAFVKLKAIFNGSVRAIFFLIESNKSFALPWEVDLKICAFFKQSKLYSMRIKFCLLLWNRRSDDINMNTRNYVGSTAYPMHIFRRYFSVLLLFVCLSLLCNLMFGEHSHFPCTLTFHFAFISQDNLFRRRKGQIYRQINIYIYRQYI